MSHNINNRADGTHSTKRTMPQSKSSLNNWATQKHHKGFPSIFDLTFKLISAAEHEACVTHRPTGQTATGRARKKRDAEEDACKAMLALLEGTRPARSTKGKQAPGPNGRSKGGAALVHQEPPFEGATGVWVLATDFAGDKSFGRFECDDACAHVWGSAHAYKQFKQACRNCEEWHKPYCMWQNETADGKARQGKSSSPHDKKRCEACRLGRCKSQTR